MKFSKIIGLLTFGLLFSGCSSDVLNETSIPAPYEQIEGILPINELNGEDILANYTEYGQTILRIALPDINHRHYAITKIGTKAPDMEIDTIDGTLSLKDYIGKKTLLNISSATTSITEEMAAEMEIYRKEAENVEIINFYPNNTVEEVVAFHDKTGYHLDKNRTIAGSNNKSSDKLTEQLNFEEVPTLIYIDETGTISFVSIGFRDAILLKEDNEEYGFNGPSLFSHIIGYEEQTKDE